MAKMSQKDRAALKSIVKQRFSILVRQLDRRREELESAFKQEEIELAKERIEKAKVLASEFEKKANAFNEVTAEYIKKIDSLEVEPAQRYLVYFSFNSTVETCHDFQPTNLNKKVYERVQQVFDSASAIRLGLAEKEAELVEKLLLDSIESDEAKAFLAQVPTIESLLPTSKQIEN